MFATVSPPRNRFVSENGWPFGWRRTAGFWAETLSSSVIRRTAFAAVRAFAAAPGSSTEVPVNGRSSPSSGWASTISPKRA